MGYICHSCGEHVEQPVVRGGQCYHPVCWAEILDEEAARETPEEAREGWEEDTREER